MKTNVSQRWRARRDSYRPLGETIRPSDYEVALIADDTTAKTFVEAHHYSGSYPAARERAGLYRRGSLVGVAVFSVPMHERVLRPLPCPKETSAELGRLVLLDDVPANGETWFLARAFELLAREGYEGLISFADPMPRMTALGACVFAGHIGNVYQAKSAIYVGRGTKRTIRLLPSGEVFSSRAAQKIRSLDRGYVYAAGQLEAAGAEPLDTSDPRGWLRRWMPALTRTVRHPGNHKYVLPIDRRIRRHLPPSLPYPKFTLQPREAA
jgi:hypothetical protein